MSRCSFPISVTVHAKLNQLSERLGESVTLSPEVMTPPGDPLSARKEVGRKGTNYIHSGLLISFELHEVFVSLRKIFLEHFNVCHSLHLFYAC